MPGIARAQYGAPTLDSTAIGEKYHVELAGTLWNPNVFGMISSEQWGIAGSQIDFTGDLGFKTTRFKDLRATLRPSRKTKFRIQYTPVRYQADSLLKRSLVFNGQSFPLNLPVKSTFDWNVLRVGLEYDFIYRSRGFVGLLLEARYTEMNAALSTPLTSESTSVKAPLPAAGIVGRAYVLPELALNFEVSTFRMPQGLVPDVEANYYDWNIDGTVNLTHHVGLQVGWRRMTNFLSVKEDLGETKFQGLWFGAALRY
ncbi:MAG: hypothetical protein IT184_07300 [Acidobacteria bacterium]|nr:hypothetical protein [Acidobacteriota bacterium]